jgi:hypothetical protein
MLDVATPPGPHRSLLAVILSAALACTAAWTLARLARHGEDARFVHARFRPFSMWSALASVGCSPPNERGTFIARNLLPDENGNPYIFECTDDGLVVNGARLR